MLRAFVWLFLSASASALLVATTNRIGQDVPAVPFLFILPLCLYLITCILAFDSARWHVRPPFCSLLPIAIGGAVGGLFSSLLAAVVFDPFVEYPIALLACFVGVMVVVCLDLRKRFRRSAGWVSKSAARVAAYSIAGCLVFGFFLTRHLEATWEGLVGKSRNFMGCSSCSRPTPTTRGLTN